MKSPAEGSRQFPAKVEYDQRVMPGSIISRHWMPCAFREHLPLSEFVIRELDLFPTLELFTRVDGASLKDIWRMTVACRHFPCIYEKNGKLTDIITTVENALRLCQMDKNSSMQELNSAIQYFHDIGWSDILEMQIIYSL